MLFPCFILLSVQEINQDLKEDRLNFMLPGCLFPFKDLICKLFAKEKSKFLANKRFNAVFSNTSLQPAFKNRQNLKNLVSRSKINWIIRVILLSENKANSSWLRALGRKILALKILIKYIYTREASYKKIFGCQSPRVVNGYSGNTQDIFFAELTLTYTNMCQ